MRQERSNRGLRYGRWAGDGKVKAAGLLFSMHRVLSSYVSPPTNQAFISADHKHFFLLLLLLTTTVIRTHGIHMASRHGYALLLLLAMALR